jgi:hypothetical protein
VSGRAFASLAAALLVGGACAPAAGPARPSDATSAFSHASRACVVSLGDYCRSLRDGCPGYAVRTEQLRRLCPVLRVRAADCGGGYRSLSWQDTLLGTHIDYFDQEGQQVGTSQATDYQAYCGGTSFTLEAGTQPPCSTPVVRADL